MKAKFFSQDIGALLDVIHIDFLNNKFTVQWGNQKITLDNIDNVLIDFGDGQLIRIGSRK